MKTQYSLLFFCLLLTTGLKSQNLTFGGTLNVGLSKVTSDVPISGDYRVRFALSGNAGLFLEKKIGQSSALGIEALWVQIEGKETADDKILRAASQTGEGLETIGVISDKATVHTSYVGVPFYYRFAAGKFGIKAGVQPMIFLFASSNYEAEGEISGEPYAAKSSRSDIVFDRIDLGPKIGIDYRLNEKIRLRADYYHGLTDITSDEFPWERRNRQVSLGVGYVFGSSE